MTTDVEKPENEQTPRATICYTPGPWTLEQQRENQWGTAIGEPVAVVGGEATGEPVEFVIGRTCDFGPHGADMTEANARIVWNAPVMFEALRKIRSVLNQRDRNDVENEAFHEANRALLPIEELGAIERGV